MAPIYRGGAIRHQHPWRRDRLRLAGHEGDRECHAEEDERDEKDRRDWEEAAGDDTEREVDDD